MKTASLLAVALGLAGCGDNIGVTGIAGLSDLSVSGAVGPLYPTFDREIRRYGVRIDSQQPVSLRAVAADTSNLVLIDGEVAEPDHLLDGLSPGDVVEISVLDPDDGETSIYELVALPRDFPDLETTVLEDGVSEGRVFVGLRGSAYFVTILDNHGVPHFFRREAGPVFDFKRQPSGEYTYAVSTGERNEHGRRQSVWVVLNRDLEEIDRVETVGLNHTDNHEFLIRPNGNYTLISYNGSYRDMTAFGLSESELVEDSVIQEITPAGEVVFEWNSWGHISFGDRLRDSSDYAHVNSVFYDTDGNLLLSARAVSRVVKVDTTTGEVIWNLGGQQNDFTFVDDPYSHLCGQHTASRLANGNILVFDNGQMCFPEHPDRGELTRVVEYRLDESAMTATLVWSYSRPEIYTRSQGSAQRLANGNTFIGWGRSSEILATEVDPDGDVVFEISATEPGEEPLSYRAWRLP